MSNYFDDCVKEVKKDIKQRVDCISKESIEIDLLKWLFDKFGESPDKFFYSCKGVLQSKEGFIEKDKEELKILNDKLVKYKELAK